VAIVKLLRYSDLKAAGIVNSRVALSRLIKFQQFSPGRLLSPNTRVWGEDEVQAWLASRPVERSPDTIPREQRFAGSAEQPARRAAAKSAKAATKRTAPKRKRRGREPTQ
jgi:predicted DNA-binding transcriptional regulator AlpA